MDLLKALDVLSTAPLKTESEADRQVKLKALRTIDEQLSSPALRGTADFPRLLAFSLHSLLRLLGDSDMNVWSLAEEVLHKVVKGLIRTHHDWIIVELYKGLKGQRFAGRSQRVSLALLGHVIGWTSRSRLKKLTAAIPKLIGQLISTAQQDSLLIEALALHFEPIMRHVAPYITGTQVLTLVDHCVLALVDTQGAVRRSGAGLITTLCRYWPSPALFYHVFGTLRQLLQRTDQSSEHDIHTMQGVLHCYLRLIRLHLEQPRHTAEYLLPEIQFIASLATDSLKHTDSNVVVSALELLQELLSSFLHVLIHVWTPERARDRFKALLDQFEVMLFEDSAVRISSQSLIVACVAHIFEHYWIDYAHLSRDHSTAPSTVVTFEPLSMFLESKLAKWSSLLAHSDPQLRGQAALFVAATQSAVLVNPRAPPGPEPLGAWAAQPLLQLILDDESSVAAKWGGQALARLWPALVSHAPPALPLSVLARILAVKSDAYLLVKIKVLSFLSRVDFRVIAALEEKIRHGNHVTQIGDLSINRGTDLQKTALDVILQYLDDADHRVRRRAAKTLVKILPQLHAAPYLEGAQSRLQAHAVVLAEYLHGAPKSQSDKLNYLLWRIESSLNARESQQIKGVYEWCALLSLQGHVIPAQFIPIMLEHLSATNLATHLETQLHALTVMEHMVGELTGELAPYSVKILTHVLKVLAITTYITQNKSASQVREMKSAEGLATPLLGEAIYLALWDRLRDTHRLAQASFTANLFDQIRCQALLALGATVHVLGKNAVPYCEELLLHLPAHLDEYPLEVLTCVRELFVCVFHPQNISNTIPQGNSSPNASTTPRRKKPAKLGLHEKLFHPELFRRSVKKNLNYATLDINSEEEWVLNASTINSTTKSSATAKNTLKMFEPLVTLALARYHNSQNHVLKNAVLALLVAFLHLGVDFWALDRENKLLKEVLLDLEQARDQPVSVELRDLSEEVTRVNRVPQPATCVLPQVRLMHVLLITLLHPSRRQHTTATVQQLVALLAPVPQAAVKSPIMKQPLMNLFATKPALPSPSQSWEELKLFLALLGDLLLDHVRVYLPNKEMHSVINSILRTLFTVTLAEDDEDWHRDLRARLINLFTELLATDPSEHVIDHLRFVLQLTKDKHELHLTVSKQIADALLKLATDNTESLTQLADVTALYPLIDQLPKAAIDVSKLLTSLFLANLPTKLRAYELDTEIERANDKLFSELPPLNLPVPAVNLSTVTAVTPVTPVDISAALVETYVSEDKNTTPQGSPNKEGAGLLSPSTPLEASEISRDIQSPEPANEAKQKSRDHQHHSYEKSAELLAQCHHTSRLLTRRTRLCWIYSALVLFRLTAKHEVRELTSVTAALAKQLSRTLDLAELCHVLLLESAQLLALYSHDSTSTRAVNLFLEQVTRLIDRSKQSSSQLLLDMGSDSQLHLLVRALLDQGSSRDRHVLTNLIEHAHLSTTGLLLAQLLLNLEAYDVLRYLFDHVRNKTRVTWHSELLQTLLFLYQCKLIVHERYHPDKMRAMIDQLVNNEPYLEALAHNMHEEVVLQLVQSFTQPTWHDKLISFVNNHVSGAELSAVTCHHLLLLLISVPPKEHSLRVVFKVFMRHSHVSVKIAAENYIVSMLNEFHIDKNDASVTDSMIKLLIDEYRAQLRPSFVNRLKAFHWLQMETPALSRTAEIINQGLAQTNTSATTELLINFDEFDHVPAEKAPTPVKLAEQSELIPTDMNAFIGNYLARQLPHHVSNAKMIQWLTAVMHVDSHVFEIMLNCKHCKLSHVTYCFQLNTCEHVKPHLLSFLKRKNKELLDERSHVTDWSELVDLTRATMLAIERWGEEALEALVESPALPILVQTWLTRITKLLTRAQHVTPTSTVTVMHVLRLAASIFKRSLFGIDEKFHVTRLSISVPSPQGDTPLPDSATNNSTDSHDVSRALNEFFVQLMNLYYTVFHPNRSMPVKITDSTPVTTADTLLILEFFWRLLRDPTKSIFGSLALKFKYCHELFLALLKEIAVKFDIPDHVPSAPSPEDLDAQNSPPDPRLPHNRTPFPFQVLEINFDHNDDPVTTLTHFVRLINTLKICHPRVVNQLWQQLYQVFAEKEENSQGSFATSQQLKALAVQGLASLLLRISYNWILPAPEEEVDPSLNLGLAKLREIYPLGRLTVPQLRQSKLYQWHSVDISLLIEDLLMLCKHHVDSYLAHTTPHLTLHRAVIKAVLLLSDLFTRQQYLWMQQMFERIYYAGLPLDPTARTKDDTDHVLADDFLVDQYVLIGLCKAAAVLELPNSATQITSPNKDNKEPPGPVLTPNLVRRMSITFLGNNTNAPNLNLNKEGLVSGVVPWGLKLAALHGLNFAFQGYSYLKVTSVPPSVMALIDSLAQETIDHYVDDNNRVPSLLKMEQHHLTLFMNRLNLSVISANKSRDLRDSSSSSGSAANSPASVHSNRKLDLDADEEMMNMEVVKTMFAKIRTNKNVTKNALSNAAVEELAKIQLPNLLLQKFSSDQIMSLVLAEFSKPIDTNLRLVALVLFKVFKALRKRKEQAVVVRWVVMCMGNFTQLSTFSNKSAQALWSLLVVMLAASRDRLWSALVWGLLADDDWLNTDLALLPVALADFVARQELEASTRQLFLDALKDLRDPIVRNIEEQLAALPALPLRRRHSRQSSANSGLTPKRRRDSNGSTSSTPTKSRKKKDKEKKTDPEQKSDK